VGWLHDHVLTMTGKTLAFLLACMKELCTFIDKSDDFGDYDFHSTYYILLILSH